MNTTVMATTRLAPEKAVFRPALSSPPYAGALPEGAVSDYLEKLKDPRWQRKRLEILSRDCWQCRICLDTTKTLHVHHRRYLAGREPWDYPDNLLVTLCCDCHADETAFFPRAVDRLVGALADAGATSHNIERIAQAFEGSRPLNVNNWNVVAFTLQTLLRSRAEDGGNESGDWRQWDHRCHTSHTTPIETETE